MFNHSGFLSSSSPTTLLIAVDLSTLEPSKRAMLFDILGAVPHAAEPALPAAPKGKSFPLTIGQAAALVDAIDHQTVLVLRALAEAYSPATGKGEVNWNVIRKIVYGNAGDDNEYHRFTKGRVGGVHRSLRYITKDQSAKLMLSTGNSYYIDGEAILSLRSVFNIV